MLLFSDSEKQSVEPVIGSFAELTRGCVVLSHNTPPRFLQTPPAQTQKLWEASPLAPILEKTALVMRVELLVQMTRLVGYLHEQGVVHRDLKPEAFFLSSGGLIGLGGFESAKSLGATSGEAPAMIGTPGYAPPEQLRNYKDEFEPRSDIFSLGALFYELLSGQKAFSGKNRLALILATTESEPTPLVGQLPLCPEKLSSLIKEMLSKQKEARPKSCLAVKEALEEILSLLQKDTVPQNTLVDAEVGLARTLGALDAPKTEVEGLAPTMGSHEVQQAPHRAPHSSSGASESRPNSQKNSAQDALPLRSGGASTHPARGTHRAAQHLTTVEKSHYEMSGELARGGLGKISVAIDTRLSRQVAVKELLRDRGVARERFLREALLTARLQHPGIVPIYEAGVWPTGEPFYTMKLISGRPFDKVIKEAGSFEERLSYLPHILAACEAMGYAHSQKIIHRDLKPHNLIIGEYGETIIIDWGLAKDLASNEPEPEIEPTPYRYREQENHNLTQAGEVMGTPAYMPIEQARGKPVDEKADVYSLGGILYHLLTGQPPYSGRKSLQVLQALLDKPPVPLEEREPKAPKDLVAIVQKAMSREAKERYPTAKELADDLKKYLTGQLVGVYKYSFSEQLARFLKRHRAAVAVAAIAASLLAAFGVYSFLRITQERNEADAQRKLAISASALAQTEKEKALAQEARATQKESIANQMLKEELLKGAYESLEKDPSESLAKLKKSVELPGENDWPRIRMIALGALSKGVSHGPGGLEDPILTFPAKPQRAVFSPDGKKVAVARSDGYINLLYPKETNRREWKAHEGEVYSVEFSEDGSQILSAGRDGKISLLDIETGQSQEVMTLPDIASAATMKGGLVAAGGYDGYLYLLDGGLEKYPYGKKIYSLQFSEDKKWIAIAGDSGPFLFHIEKKKMLKLLQDDELKNIASAGVSFIDNTKVAFVFNNGMTRIFTEKSNQWKLEKESQVVKTSLWSVDVDRQNSQLVVSSSDGIYVLDLQDLRKLSSLQGHQREVRSVSLSPSAGSIVSAGFDGSVRFWDTDAIFGKTMFNGAHKISTLLVSQDGGSAFFGEEDGTISRLAVSSQQIELVGKHPGIVRNLTLSEDHTKLLSSGVGDSIILWDLQSKDKKVFQVAFGDYISYLSPDAKWIAFNNYEKTEIGIIDVVNNKIEFINIHTKYVHKLLFDPQGTLYSCGIDEKIFTINASTKEASELGFGLRCTYFDLSRDAKTMAILGYSPAIQIKDLSSKKERATLKGRSEFFTAKMSEDASYLVALDVDGAAYLWDLRAPSMPVTRMIGYLSDAPFAFSPTQGASFWATTGAQAKLFEDKLPEATEQLSAWLRSLPVTP